MRELAAALKISAATVSLALRNHPRVAQKTRLHVQAFAREKGYHLNPAITLMMSHVRASRPAQYTETFAWLNLWESPDYFSNGNLPTRIEYHQQMWEGAHARAEELGYSLDTFWLSAPNMSGRRISAILAARGIRGILIPPIPRSCGHLTLDWNAISAVALSYTLARPLLHRVVPDHHYNMGLILRTLRHRGFKRIGLLLPSDFDERCENRVRSAFYFYQHGLLARDRVPVLLCHRFLGATCATWLKKHRPEVVITVGSFRHLREIQIGDPSYSKKLGIVLIGYARTDVGFTAVEENPFLIGSTGIDCLVTQLNHNKPGIPANPETVLIKGAWVEGQTLPGKQYTARPVKPRADLWPVPAP